MRGHSSDTTRVFSKNPWTILRATVVLVALPLWIAHGFSVLKAAPISFEEISDGTPVSSQYPGLLFTNAMALSAGISLNEFEFPPRSGVSVVVDNEGPITLSFATPVRRVGGFFTYLEPVLLRGFDEAGELLVSSTSAFLTNLAISGEVGSSPNEYIELLSSEDLYSISISGNSSGFSFALDDLSVGDSAQLVPEPSYSVLFAAAMILLLMTGRRMKQKASQLRLAILTMFLAADTVAAQTFLEVSLSRSVVTKNTHSRVIVTAQLAGGDLIRSSVLLLQVDSSGRMIKQLGSMNDEGQEGDQLAGDGLFTRVQPFLEPQPGLVRLRVSAALRGQIRRVLSDEFLLRVTETPEPSFLLFSDPLDSRFGRITDTDGSLYQYFGTKDAQGRPEQIDGAYFKDANGNEIWITAKEGRLQRFEMSGGLSIDFETSSAGETFARIWQNGVFQESVIVRAASPLMNKGSRFAESARPISFGTFGPFNVFVNVRGCDGGEIDPETTARLQVSTGFSSDWYFASRTSAAGRFGWHMPVPTSPTISDLQSQCELFFEKVSDFCTWVSILNQFSGKLPPNQFTTAIRVTERACFAANLVEPTCPNVLASAYSSFIRLPATIMPVATVRGRSVPGPSEVRIPTQVNDTETQVTFPANSACRQVAARLNLRPKPSGAANIVLGTKVTMTVSPEDTNSVPLPPSAYSISWLTTPPNVLSVDGLGVVTAIGAGEGSVCATDQISRLRDCAVFQVQPRTVSVTVPATSTGISTELHVTAGQVLNFSATGLWANYSFNPAFPPFGPDGGDPSRPNEFEKLDTLLPTVPFGVLLGKIGQVYFRIGSSPSVVMPATGLLELVMNDRRCCFGDNYGSMNVSVTVPAGQ
jgi:hypothetical protein